MHQPDATGFGRLVELGGRRQRPTGLLEQLADAARLVGGHDDGASGRRQIDQPLPRAIRATGHRRRRPVPRLRVRLLLEPLGGAPDEPLQRAGRVIGQRPVLRQLSRFNQAGPTVGGLRIELLRQRAQLGEVRQDEVRGVRDVVGGRPRGEECGPRLGRLRHVALREARRVLPQEVGQVGGRAVDRGLPAVGRQELGRGRQVRLLDSAPRPLGHRVERPDRFDLVAEQLDAHRPAGTGWPRVDEAATVRELADARHLDRRLVAAGHQPLEQRPLADPLPDPDRDPRGGQLRRPERALHECQERGDDHQATRRRPELGEDGQPLRGLVVLGMSAFERQRGPLGERADVRRAHPRGEVVGQPMRLLVGAGDDHHGGGGRERAPTRGEVAAAGGRGHAKDARIRQMRPEGVDERGYAAITAA
jgi:hypothetical protein